MHLFSFSAFMLLLELNLTEKNLDFCFLPYHNLKAFRARASWLIAMPCSLVSRSRSWERKLLFVFRLFFVVFNFLLNVCVSFRLFLEYFSVHISSSCSSFITLSISKPLPPFRFSAPPSLLCLLSLTLSLSLLWKRSRRVVQQLGFFWDRCQFWTKDPKKECACSKKTVVC